RLQSELLRGRRNDGITCGAEAVSPIGLPETFHTDDVHNGRLVAGYVHFQRIAIALRLQPEPAGIPCPGERADARVNFPQMVRQQASSQKNGSAVSRSGA